MLLSSIGTSCHKICAQAVSQSPFLQLLSRFSHQDPNYGVWFGTWVFSSIRLHTVSRIWSRADSPSLSKSAAGEGCRTQPVWPSKASLRCLGQTRPHPRSSLLLIRNPFRGQTNHCSTLVAFFTPVFLPPPTFL